MLVYISPEPVISLDYVLSNLGRDQWLRDFFEHFDIERLKSDVGDIDIPKLKSLINGALKICIHILHSDKNIHASMVSKNSLLDHDYSKLVRSKVELELEAAMDQEWIHALMLNKGKAPVDVVKKIMHTSFLKEKALFEKSLMKVAERS